MTDQIDRLRDAILLNSEVAWAQTAHESPLAIVDARLEQHARDLRDLGDLEGLEHDAVSALPSVAVLDLHCQLPPLERVFVGPLDSIRWTIVVSLEQRTIDVEADWREYRVRRPLNLGDDPNCPHAPGAAQRRSDTDGQTFAESTGSGRCCNKRESDR